MDKALLNRFLALSVIGSVTLMPLLVLPAMIGVLVDNAGLSDAAAGKSASAHFLASAAIGLLVSLRIHHFNFRQWARAGLLVAMIADVGSAIFAGDTSLFLSARIIAGFALGIAYVVSVASFARLEHYERGFGLFVTLQFIVSGVGLYAIPVFADQLGAGGLFLGFAALEALALLMTWSLPTSKVDREFANSTVPESKILFSAVTLLAVFAYAVFEAANNAQFTYIERFGVGLNLSDQQIGLSLLVASLIGIPGAFTIVFVGQRFGTLLPLLFGVGIAITGLFILISAQTYFAYFAGGCCMGFSWAFCLPFIQSLLAGLDRRGSAIAAGTSFSTFGSAAGPGVAALVVGGSAYARVFLLSMGLFVLTAIAFALAHWVRRTSV
ncbi:MAG: MFS transporter [Pseudomonadota bacterium]